MRKIMVRMSEISSKNNSKQDVLPEKVMNLLSQGMTTELLTILKETPSFLNLIDKKNNKTILEVAIEQGYEKLITQLLVLPNINLNILGHSPLRKAIEYGFIKLSNQLLDLGTNVNDYVSNEPSILKMCLERGYIELADKILNNGGEINARDNRGWTLLIWASFHGKKIYS